MLLCERKTGLKLYRANPPTPSGDGIVFDDTEGTVYGDVTLQEDLTIGEDETLTIPEGASLNSNGKLTNSGTIVNKGTLISEVGGTIIGVPVITGPEDVTVTEGARHF